MQAQTLIVMLIVLVAAAYVARLFWRAIRGTRAGAGESAGCASGGCGCGPAEAKHAPSSRRGIETEQPGSPRR